MTPFNDVLVGCGGVFTAITGYRSMAQWRPGRAAYDPIVPVESPEHIRAVELLFRPLWPWRSGLPSMRDTIRWRAWYRRLLTQELPNALRYHYHASFNLHSTHLLDEGIYQMIRRQLPEPTSVVIEWVEDPISAARCGQACERLRQLRDEIGVGIAIDDAGRGLDAIERISRTQPQWVKIDGGLFQAGADLPGSVADRAARAIVDIALASGAETVAEWVETPEHLAYAREIGCQLAQGWLFPRPTEMQAS